MKAQPERATRATIGVNDAMLLERGYAMRRNTERSLSFIASPCYKARPDPKLPLDSVLGGIRKRLDEEGINFRMMAKQLYHDREEVTVFLTKIKG